MVTVAPNPRAVAQTPNITVTRPTTPTAPATGTSPDDPFGGLAGSDRDAYAAMVNQLKQWGLEGLAPTVIKYIQNGYSSDTISLLLPQTPEYKQRFAANDARAKAGLPVLSPAEYLGVEQSYRQVMSAAGLPRGFYDSTDDFTSWIAGDVSPTEIQSRVQVASDLVSSADTATQDYFKQHYSHGDLVAYALDRTKAAPLIEQQYKTAQIGGSAMKAGLAVGETTLSDLAKQGVTQGQAQAGFGFIAGEIDNANKLASISGESQLTVEDLIGESFNSNADITKKRSNLASQERARFNGSAGIGKTSLSNDSGGRI